MPISNLLKTTTTLRAPKLPPNKMPRGAVVSLSHGGGPMPVLGDPLHADITRSLRERVPKILRLGTPDAPRAIVVVTAHWSEARPTVSSGAAHALVYDYGGFPPEAYRLRYPAPGSPGVAAEVRDALEAAGLRPALDAARGWDHGVFVPMMLINPRADVPVVQLSVLAGEDAAAHLRVGAALRALRDTNVAVVGSGFASLHNFALMRPLMMTAAAGGAGGAGGAEARARARAATDAFNAALTDAVREPDPRERERRLAAWRAFPRAYDIHPRGGAEHFMPLLVCAGAGGEGEAGAYKDDFAGVDIWSYYWS